MSGGDTIAGPFEPAESVTRAVLAELAPHPGTRHEIGARGATIGRGRPADLLVKDRKASRRHARIGVHSGGIAIEDLGSTNGTYVNGTRITGRTLLNDGDVVRIADTEWQLELSGVVRPSDPLPAIGAEQTGVITQKPPPGATAAEAKRIAAETALQQASFTPATAQRRGSAARRLEATVVSYAIVLATAVAVVAYLASR